MLSHCTPHGETWLWRADTCNTETNRKTVLTEIQECQFLNQMPLRARRGEPSRTVAAPDERAKRLSPTSEQSANRHWLTPSSLRRGSNLKRPIRNASIRYLTPFRDWGVHCIAPRGTPDRSQSDRLNCHGMCRCPHFRSGIGAAPHKRQKSRFWPLRLVGWG